MKSAALDDAHWMRRALAMAKRAEAKYDEVPVGAVLVLNGEKIAEGCNQNIRRHDPSAHAEIMVLRKAGKRLGNYRLPGTTLYVTLEPCAMCAMAIIHARVRRVVYAAKDPRTGAAGSVFNILNADNHNHKIEICAGAEEQEASRMLVDYFRAKRVKAKARE